jgi:hypothetical protein
VNRRRRSKAQHQLAWIVSGTAALQSLLQAVDAGLQGSLSRFLLWTAGAFVVAPLVGYAERAKVRRGK